MYVLTLQFLEWAKGSLRVIRSFTIFNFAFLAVSEFYFWRKRGLYDLLTLKRSRQALLVKGKSGHQYGMLFCKTMVMKGYKSKKETTDHRSLTRSLNLLLVWVICFWKIIRNVLGWQYHRLTTENSDRQDWHREGHCLCRCAILH